MITSIFEEMRIYETSTHSMELYVTTSQWETFGLTLMEAVGAGLALVGFDARYGNPTFIKDGENGYLVPYSETMDEDLLVSQMAEKILLALEGDLESMHQASYEVGQTVFET